MKIIATAAPVEHFGQVVTSSSFKIKSSAKAFDILVSRVYKNKIAATIRELSCNAHDSHVAAGRADVPFTVHLPTNFEPYFSVRDYGIGLSHDAITEIVTTFFESTKEDSNDFIGALGLGGKAPFSYVDIFAIYCHDGRERRTYECFLENGLPQVALKATMPSNEKIGVEVSFAVQSEDCYRFGEEARKIFEWFEVRPILTGNIVSIPPASEKQGSCWAVGNGLHAIMGQVRYPIDPSIVGTKLNNLVVYFDIGEIDVQAGREELSYDKATITNIQNKLEIPKREIAQIYEGLFHNCENLLEANLIVATSNNPLFGIIPPTWRGNTLNKNLNIALSNVARVQAFGNPIELNKSPYDELTIFIHDSGVTSQKRFNIWGKQHPDAFGYCMIPNMGMMDRLKAAIGNIPIVLSSSVSLPARKAKVRFLSQMGANIRDQPETTIDLNDGGMYLLSKNLQAVHPKNDELIVSTTDLGSIMSIVREVAPNNRSIVVPWSRKHELGDNWKNIFDVISDHYQANNASKSWQDELIQARQFTHFENPTTNRMMTELQSLIGNLLQDGPIKKFLNDWQSSKDIHANFNKWRIYENLIDPRKIQGVHDELTTVWQKIRSDFPLLYEVIKPRSNISDRVSNIAAKDLVLYCEAKSKLLAGV